MFRNITQSLIPLVIILSTLSARADDVPGEPTKSVCANASDGNVDHLQSALEGWFTGTRRPGEEYLQRIKKIESDKGVFAYDLILELIGLGLLNQEQDNHEDSAEAFQRALHIIRVNDGLYSSKQLPVIDLLIENNAELGQWEQVANSYDMMHWLYRRNYSDTDPRQLTTLKRLRRWNRESYNKETGRTLNQLFKKSEELYEQGLKIMLACTGGNKREALCFWHNSCCADTNVAHGVCPLDRG